MSLASSRFYVSSYIIRQFLIRNAKWFRYIALLPNNGLKMETFAVNYSHIHDLFIQFNQLNSYNFVVIVSYCVVHLIFGVKLITILILTSAKVFIGFVKPTKRIKHFLTQLILNRSRRFLCLSLSIFWAPAAGRDKISLLLTFFTEISKQSWDFGPWKNLHSVENSMQYSISHSPPPSPSKSKFFVFYLGCRNLFWNSGGFFWYICWRYWQGATFVSKVNRKNIIGINEVKKILFLPFFKIGGGAGGGGGGEKGEGGRWRIYCKKWVEALLRLPSLLVLKLLGELLQN